MGMLILCLILGVSCRPAPKAPAVMKLQINLDVSNYDLANYQYYVQYRSVPLFEGKNIVGVQKNWLNYTVNSLELQKGTWQLYFRIVDMETGRVMEELSSGSVDTRMKDKIDIMSRKDFNLLSDIFMYIRSQKMSDSQTLKVEFESTKTQERIEIKDEWEVSTDSDTQYIDYSMTLYDMPVGNYTYKITVTDNTSSNTMTKMGAVAIRADENEPIVESIYQEGWVDAGVVIEGIYQEMEGAISAPKTGKARQAIAFTFIRIGTYTHKNASYYKWFANGNQINTNSTDVTLTFNEPGKYIVTCVPVGINGEVPRYGAITHTITIMP